jgi:hypothetical protein
MSTGEAGECGVMLLRLYAEVLRQDDGLSDVATLVDDDAPVVPPFLVKSVS